jgi:hypothetical protein
MSTSHHNSDDDSILKDIPHAPDFAKHYKDALSKALGTFPDEKIHTSDEGATVFAIGEHKGRLVIEFPTPCKWIGFDVVSARRLRDRLSEFICPPAQTPPKETP